MKFFIKLSSYVLASGVIGTSIHQTSHLKTSCFANNRWDFNWDNNKGSVSGATKHVLLIRHGQYHTQGNTDSDKTLTAIGQQQAKEVGKYISQICRDEQLPINKVVCSTMRRAIQTCEIASLELPVGTPSPKITDYIKEGAAHTFSPPVQGYYPTLEDIEQNQKRLDIGFGDYFNRPLQPGTTLEVFFCHANVIRYFFCKALQLPLNAWLRFSLRHCSVTHLVFKGDGSVGCRVYGDTGFMSPDMRTTK